MPGRARLIDPFGTYHIIARGNNKAPLFHSDEDSRLYLRLIREAKYLYNISIYHYCLMTNHVHLMIRLNGTEPGKFIHQVHLAYAKYFCRTYQYVGHVWQGRYKSLRIDSERYYLTCGKYIELNPVRANIVDGAADWKYSSYRFYAFGETDDLVDEDPLFADIGLNPEQRRNAYRQIVRPEPVAVTKTPKVTVTKKKSRS